MHGRKSLLLGIAGGLVLTTAYVAGLRAQDRPDTSGGTEMKVAADILKAVKAEREKHYDRMLEIQRQLDQAVRKFRGATGPLDPVAQEAKEQLKALTLKRIDEEVEYRSAVVAVVKDGRTKLAAEVQELLQNGQAPPPNLLDSIFAGGTFAGERGPGSAQGGSPAPAGPRRPAAPPRSLEGGDEPEELE
ncbi:MAG: hypothetical protein HYZ53_07635 [Planctomycetes bacterium]|nr:hypothetical protein [Planctomycetota bacterium]